MRKFALLFAFVLVLACAGGAFAGSPYHIDLKDLRSPSAISDIKAVADGEVIVIDNSSDGSGRLMDPSDYKFIYDTLKDNTGFTIGTHTFDLQLGDDQTEIPAGAFKNYRGNVKITPTIGKLKKIGDSAFEGIIGDLTLVNVVDAYATGLVEIGKDAFKNSVFATMTTPEIKSAAFKTMGSGAFNGSNITGFTFTTTHAEFTTIPAEAFMNCSVLANVTYAAGSVPGLTTISASAFENCAALTAITLTNAVALTAIGDRAFANCINSSLTSVSIPATVKTIGKEAFEGCVSLATATFAAASAQLTDIGIGAFRNCKVLATLSNFEKLENIKTIGAYAFAQTKLGDDLKFHSALKNIGEGAFNKSAFSPAANLVITFRSGTTSPANTKLNTAADVAEFLGTLNMSGAFSNAEWPASQINTDTIVFGYYDGSLTQLQSMYSILSQLQPNGGIANSASDPTTKKIVGILKGAGFGVEQIYSMFYTNASTYALDREVIANIAATNSDGTPATPPADSKDAVENAIKTAIGNANALKTNKTEAGDYYYTTEAKKNAFLAALNGLLTRAGALTAGDTAAAQALTSELNALVATYTTGDTSGDYGHHTDPVPPVDPPTSGDNRSGGSTGGSGGCAAGFAPMAALFVLGALKLRKGR